MHRIGFYFDMTSCIGCHVCEFACKDLHRHSAEVSYRKIKAYECGKFPNPGLFYYSGTCNHCTNAPCVAACPTGALHYAEDLTVQLEQRKCIHCKRCMKACPYSAITWDAASQCIGKCDFCLALRDEGKNPLCVDACPTRALDWGEMEMLQKKYGENLVKEFPRLKAVDPVDPALVIKLKKEALDENAVEKRW